MTNTHVYSLNDSFCLWLSFFSLFTNFGWSGFYFVADKNITPKYIATIRISCKNGILELSKKQIA